MTREDLQGSYSEGEALAIYEEVKASGDFTGFAQRFIHDEDYQVARNALWDFCLEHAIDVSEYPGIQSIAIKLAYKMCSFYPELMTELMRTLEAMEMDYYKPAVKSIRNRILSGKYKYHQVPA